MRIDHVVWAAADLDVASGRFSDLLGFNPIAGGVHQRWGTANRIFPLGEDYIELLGVVDASVADGSWLGRRLLGLETDRWFAVCVSDSNLEATAARLGLEVEPGERTLPSGHVVRWTSAGLQAPGRGDSLPFFIRWEVPTELHPARMGEIEPGWAIERVETGAQPESLVRWTGETELPIVATGAGDGVGRVTVRSPAGPIVIG